MALTLVKRPLFPGDKKKLTQDHAPPGFLTQPLHFSLLFSFPVGLNHMGWGADANGSVEETRREGGRLRIALTLIVTKS